MYAYLIPILVILRSVATKNVAQARQRSFTMFRVTEPSLALRAQDDVTQSRVERKRCVK